MLRSKDKTRCRTQKHSRAPFLSFVQHFTVMDTKRYHTSVPRKAKIYHFVQSTFLQQQQKTESAHKTQMCVWQLYVSRVINHFKATIWKWSLNKKVPVPTLSTKLQITRAKLLICLYHDSSTWLIFFILCVHFLLKWSTRHSCRRRHQSCCFRVEPAVQQQHHHTILLGLQYTDNVITKPSTTGYEYIKKTSH